MITEYGEARINSLGYYVIVSHGDYFNKYLHRLIFEDLFKVTLLSSAIIHHKDGNKLNNNPNNLELVSKTEHNKIHHFGKKNSEETIRRMRESKIGKNNSMFGTGSTGYYRVYKQKNSQCKQGFTYVYEYRENGKKRIISRVNIQKLEEVVKSRDLPWFKIEEVV